MESPVQKPNAVRTVRGFESLHLHQTRNGYLNDIPDKLRRHQKLVEDIEQTRECINRHKHEIKMARSYLEKKEEQQEQLRDDLRENGFLV